MIVHAADIHLGFRAFDARGKHLNLREEDVYRAWNDLIIFCLQEKPHYLLLAGDIFDSPTPPAAAIQQAIRLGTLPCKVILVMGNHERPRVGEISPVEILNQFENIHVATKPELYRERSTDIIKHFTEEAPSFFLAPDTGFDYELEPATYLVAHGMLEGPQEYMHQTKYLEINQDNYTYCALGDLHRPFVRGNIVYPGSITRMTFAQEGLDCGFVVIEDSGEIVRKQVFSRRYITLSSREEIDAFLKEAPTDLPVIRLIGINPVEDLPELRKLALQVKILRKSLVSNTANSPSNSVNSLSRIKGATFSEEYINFSLDKGKKHLVKPGLEVIKKVDS